MMKRIKAKILLWRRQQNAVTGVTEGSISRILFPQETPRGNDHSSGPAVTGGIVRPYPRTRPGRTAQPSDG